ncbi:hypothetical protein CFP56_013683 [Quercus suber]|uniref:Uncharacterized protein n=1 Tax=Quercus suber TaxID=58331 RepID=A0AAW0KUZ3_QUESU
MNCIQGKDEEDFERRKATIHCVDKKDKLNKKAAGIAIYWAQNSNEESPWLTIVLQGTTNM